MRWELGELSRLVTWYDSKINTYSQVNFTWTELGLPTKMLTKYDPRAPGIA